VRTPSVATTAGGVRLVAGRGGRVAGVLRWISACSSARLVQARRSRDGTLVPMHGDRNMPDHPSCTMFANRAAAEPPDRTTGDRRAIGLCHPPVAHNRLCGPPRLGAPFSCWALAAQGRWRVRNARRVVGVLGRSVVRVRPTLRPAVGLPSTPETGWTSARPGPGYDPGGIPARGRSVLRGRCCPGPHRPGRCAHVSHRRRPVSRAARTPARTGGSGLGRRPTARPGR
jgi:hypothetical protein